jgi:hypothetical protein
VVTGRAILALMSLQTASAMFCLCTAQKPATNLDLLRDMMGDVAASVKTQLALAPDEHIAVTVSPAEVAWALDERVVTTFAPAVPASESTAVHALFGVRDVQIRYDDVSREGLFGSKTAHRSVRMTVAVRVTRGSSGERLLNTDLLREHSDRILLAEIPSVEHPTLTIARGSLEPEGMFQGVAEPLILIGAIGVAVFLLFHVRS